MRETENYYVGTLVRWAACMFIEPHAPTQRTKLKPFSRQHTGYTVRRASIAAQTARTTAL